MPRNVNVFTDLVLETGREKLPFLSERYESYNIEDPDEILQARKLATVCFTNLGKISNDEVNQDGILIEDKLLSKSEFFGVFDNKSADRDILATARLIWRPDTTIDEMRLPMEHVNEPYKTMFEQYRPGGIAEIGSLAKASGAPTFTTLKLLRGMWRFAAENNIDKFVCGLEPKVFPHYKKLFGSSLHELTDGTIEFPGINGQQKPLMIDVFHGMDDVEKDHEQSALDKLQRFVVGSYITQDLSK
ncbi:MAG: hypothetical protein L0H36_03310 [bacterium]|nr:hypothetical protein [bacterium]